MIKISNLNKYFNKGKKNELHVLKDISYTFPDTGLVSILGESGSGKSTLINLIGGLLYHDEDIIIDDKVFNNKNIRELEEYRNNNIGYIFQSYLVYKDLSVYDNLKLSLNVLGIYDEDEINKRINYVLDILKLTKYKKKKASELSGGEQQRLSIARALIKKCKIYICDEPTGNLDTKNSINVMNILKVLSKDALVILVTHNVGLAQTYSDTIIHMCDGKFVEKEIETNTINVNSVNDLYLEDYKSTTLSNDNININFYNNDDTKLEIKLVYKDNKLYINSDNVEVISNVKFKEKRETYEEQLSDFKYDNSNFNDVHGKDLPWYKLLFNNLKFKKNNTKKDRLLHLSSIILSVIIMLLMFMSTDSIDTLRKVTINYDDHMVMNGLYDDSTKIDRYNAIKELYDSKAIKNVHGGKPYVINFGYQEFPGKDNNYNLYSCFYKFSDDMELISGDKDNEGIFIAESLLNERDNVDYDKIVGLNVLLEDNFHGKRITTKIAGVTKHGRSIYYKDDLYESFKLRRYNFFNIDDYKKEYGDFEIITEMTDEELKEAHIEKRYYVSESLGYRLGRTFDGSKDVTGIIKDNPKIHNLVITDSKISTPSFTSNLELYDDSIKIVEGNKPVNLGDIVVPIQSKYKIGSTILMNSKTFKVVGLYDKLEYANASSLTNEDTYRLGNHELDSQYAYDIVDKAKHDEIINKYELVVKSDHDIVYDNSMDITNIVMIAIFLSFILLDILLMYIINRVTFYNNKESFLIIRSISGNTNYIKKRYITSILANNIKYLFIPMFILYLVYVYIFFNHPILVVSSLLFIGSFILLFASSLLINYIYINKQLKKEPLFLERKYDL